MLDAIGNAIGNAADAVKEGVASVAGDAAMSAALTYAEKRIKELTKQDIEVTIDDVPDEYREWVRKTGVNSLCVDDTWDFLEESQYNMRKVELWKERNIDKIVMKVNAHPDEEEYPYWMAAWVDWAEGSKTVTITWLPRALRWSSHNHWWESGSKSWWVIRDQLVFKLQLYQLPGKCFYKSDWLDGWEDRDPDSFMGRGSKKYKRWFQFRHWCLYYYGDSQWGWNYQWTTTPPKNEDGSDFSLDNVLSLPSMPDISLPSISLPSLPNVSMPSLPDAPSLPSLSAPSLSAPSLSAPSLGSLPSIPDRPPMPPKGRWDCHGCIELNGLKAKASGKDLILSNATVHHFYRHEDGRYETEKEERKRWVLTTTSAEQAMSWVESLKESGVEEGDAGGGCCVVA